MRDGFEVVAQGDLFKVKYLKTSTNKISPPTAKRGHVTKFSAKSRKRMLEKVATLLRDVVCHFVTLTYTDDSIPNDSKQLQSHMRAFFERLRRNNPVSSGVWRIEIEPRKSGRWKGYAAPHIHMLLFSPKIGLPEIDNPHYSGWIHETWSEILTASYGFDVAPRTDHKVVHGSLGVRKYTAKYAAKAQQSLLVDLPYSHGGRYWGVFNSEFLPSAEAIKFTVAGHKQAFYEIRRSIRRAGRSVEKKRGKQGFKVTEKVRSRAEGQGFTYFTNDVDKWVDYLITLIEQSTFL